jgi:hypothetical protein
MFTRSLPIKLLAVALVILAACSILKKEDTEKDVRTFLTAFQQDLGKSEQEVLAHFDARQSQESILSAVKILQNKEHEFIVCTIAFANAQISKEKEGIKVIIPANFSSQNVDEDYHGETNFTLWLKPKDNTYVIAKLEAEQFYETFADLRNQMEWSVDHIREMKKREPIYARAKALQQQYDSVVWYATYEGQNYYYVVQGPWTNFFMDYNSTVRNTGHQMGLVDEQGTVVIPVKYELIGTPGFEQPGLVEVKRGGKAGYFNLETKQEIIPVEYDVIIPYKKENAFALVKQDTVYGWIDQQYAYHPGFPSAKAEQWVNDFAYLPQNLRFKSDIQTFCEIPNVDNAGYGIVIPPSYLVQTGLFNEIIGGITTTTVQLNGWTEYVETKGTILQQITDNIKAVVTTINSRYIEGREEFYTYNRLSLVDNNQDTLAVSSLYSNGNIAFKKIGTSLLEIKYEQDNFEGSEFDEYNIPVYNYFTITNGQQVTKQVSDRSFAQSQFVRLDSAYLSGDFLAYKPEGEVKSTFLSLPTVVYMRAEILASYGYIFEDANMADRFKNFAWYKPRFNKVEDFASEMSEMDRYNVAFLEKIIAILESKPV